MYPIAFRFHGIRDFVPLKMDLGGAEDDVLVGGLNGSGKSTLVYAMSFALVSGRILVDGLRSKTVRREADPWQALAGLLFHNPPGPEQKDAPEYVELVSEVRSPAGSERKYTGYYLYGGETPDRLSQLRRFETRVQAHDYYRRVFNIDADGYFMFWYQGSIAEFANISDTARFQRVAEMFGLDEIQREWRVAREEMHRAGEDFEQARNVALIKKRRLQELEKYKNALEQRNRIRRDALLLLEFSRGGLLRLAAARAAELRQREAAQDERITTLAAEREEMDRELRDAQYELEQRELRRQEAGKQVESLDRWLRRREQELVAWRQERDGIQKRIAEIEGRMRHIHRSRDELQQEQGRLQQVLAGLQQQLAQLEQDREDLRGRQRETLKREGALQDRTADLQEKMRELQRLDAELPPLGKLQNRASQLARERDELVARLGRQQAEVDELAEELQRLESRQTLLLPEQERVLEIYRQAGIEAISFGELFEAVAEEPRAENVLGPLKHTVFVRRLLEGAPVEKSFYVVPAGDAAGGPVFFSGDRLSRLQRLVRMVPEVAERLSPEFVRDIKRWLAQVEIHDDGEERPGGRGKLRLWRGTLRDAFGVRGPVEQGEAIGVAAVEQARARIRRRLDEQRALLEGAEAHRRQVEQELNQVSEMLRTRQQVDRKQPVCSAELQAAGQELAAVREQLEQLADRLSEVENNRDAARLALERNTGALKQVEGELAVYAEYEREAESISRLRELEKQVAEGEAERDRERSRRESLAGEMELLAGEMRTLREQEDNVTMRLTACDRDLGRLREERREMSEQAESLEIEADEHRQELEEMRREFAPVIEDLRGLGQWQVREAEEREFNRANLERKLHEGRNMLEDAMARVVDEDAAERYDSYAYEFNEAARELEESQLRFENLKQREARERDRYDKAVYMRWKRANERFGRFMERLGMVGRIESVPPAEDDRNPSYRWELHVSTRIGHKPERVGPETGKMVGEGISGGERAATSLLFALALLGDIEQKPPFYVLDEFDSALDEERKHEIFDLYRQELGRKLIVVSPKVHGDRYLDRFGKFHCVVANPGVEPGRSVSEVYDVTREKYREIREQEEEQT